MGISLITYSGETVTPMNDAIVYDTAIGQSGILHGVEVSASSNVLTISGGYGVVCGRLFQITTDMTNVVLASSGTLQGRAYVKLDLSNVSSPISIEVETGSSLSALTKNIDANYENSVYCTEIASFTVTTTEITDLVRTANDIHGGTKIIDDEEWSLNDITSNGMYYFDHEHTPTDNPGTVANGWVQVLTGGAAKKQILWRHGSENTQTETWVRTFTSGAWTSWRRLVSENEMYYMPGQQSAFYINCGGFMTSGKTYIGTLIPLSKPIHSSVSTVTVVNNTNKISIRQNGAYIANEALISSFSPTLAVRTNGLQLNLNKSSGFGGTNNDSVALTGYITVKFN